LRHCNASQLYLYPPLMMHVTVRMLRYLYNVHDHLLAIIMFDKNSAGLNMTI
jgi:hypothetical protein